MCKYITHLRVCYVCHHEETVLITESPCPPLRGRGAFGSCQTGTGNKTTCTPFQCWKCKERVHRISQVRSPRHVSLR